MTENVKTYVLLYTGNTGSSQSLACFAVSNLRKLSRKKGFEVLVAGLRDMNITGQVQ